MARLRTLKPGFFTDDDLLECEPLARLLFAGMWTEADREGRLEDRPKRLKHQLLPGDNCDAEALLGQLAAHGLIVRYEVDSTRYIAIPTWKKHQQPHSRETASTIPPAPEHQPRQVQAPAKDDASTPCLLSLGSCLLSSEKPIVQSKTAIARRKADFAAFWTAYGNKRERSKAEPLYWHWRDKGASADDLLTAAKHYREDCQLNDRKMKLPATFLAKATSVWRDYVDFTPNADASPPAKARVDTRALWQLSEAAQTERRQIEQEASS